MLCRKGVLKNFANSQENTCATVSFLIKVAGLSQSPEGRTATLLKKRLWHRCFPVNFTKFLRTPFFYRKPPVAASDYIGTDSLSQLIFKLERILDKK